MLKIFKRQLRLLDGDTNSFGGRTENIVRRLLGKSMFRLKESLTNIGLPIQAAVPTDPYNV